MRSNLTAALAFIDEDEGPEVNVSAGEPGGASSHGLSVTVLTEYNLAHGLPKANIIDMYKMTAELAGKVYVWRFLDPLRFDDLPSGIDYRMADAAITLGASGSCSILQMSMQMWPVTEIMDEATLAQVKKADPKIIIAALDAAWIVWKRKSSVEGWHKFGRGWNNRVIRVRDRALAMLAT